MQETHFLTEANRFICEQRLNSPDINNRPGLKSLLQARLCNLKTGNTDQHSLVNQPQGVIYMSTAQPQSKTRQTIENLHRKPIDKMSEKDLLIELLSEIRALREVAQFGMTKAEYDGKTGQYSQFDC